jgi:pimeloyl-ACP methyl ester carboxylesterase
VSGWKRHCRAFAEIFKGAAEYNRLQAAWPALAAAAPEGDGHPVLILPGFTASDGMTAPLRDALREKSYAVHAWEGGINTGLTAKKSLHLRQRLEKIFRESGGRKVTLIGHSLGGIYARELAREFPELVRGVITIGAPFGFGMRPGAVPAVLQRLIETLSGEVFSRRGGDLAARLLTPPPLPVTSIFSKADAIADWRACLNPEAPLAENVEVAASHLGSVWNAETFAVVLDRLAQPEGGWKPFHAAAADAPPENPQWQGKGGLFGKRPG